METNLQNKSYVVTGATSGIGLATAEMLARRGANLIGIGRSEDRCRKTEARLAALHPQASIHYFAADLSLQSQVRAAAEKIRASLRADGINGLDGLVNNAGTFTYWLALSAEGFETQWAVNHLAPFILTLELLPLLQAASGRVVTVSSDSHYAGRMHWDDLQLRRAYNGLHAYENTKLANVLFTREFNRRLGGRSGVKAFAVDPGLVKTEIGFKGTPALVRWVWNLRRSGGVSPEVPAGDIVSLLGEPSIQQSREVYWKGGKPKKSSRRAQDDIDALRLWVVSEKMVGINQDGQHE